ncbi:Angiopoietin-related protein 1,Ficolin-1-A,Angiopoietin-1,Fibrinogen C domain-containing protein 1,Ryncolin-1,Tenascin-N,Angiopoietin-related protein 7,Angiopoietin-related protein 6,Ficolin-3,Fibrinogen-like protein 1,Ficolin-1,Ficolin-1-B,Angiopoietin-4,Tenascin-R,Ryncolin-2,Techylectin-5B,Fibrinogen C domain-containing protein 1-A,Microfibril-associated glycoprotein 4,Fibrinogen-like protein A,Ryncolin-3,Ficolin-2,Fibrinogen alpha chain,Tenascin,Angiopoietin-related protein 2,Techylectin-5A,Ryncolin-4,T|uniref:Fibrinogen C-terminal domain-containing protein n=1 Tax=Mytilus edulis TaxID=6550 RepID=A0A8S3UG03_MYTED|nr:Angiopoietin-related protein 1,Ficolin-1-A,Angiopoietin-1,Fibrinogen C domain-containing protein 1,Ryncolin-1,Tenascin-N,Angiopoietin-related protein 7,Angiopoietin-related protein 6,Ficolin-3,Fibrinogen-like protein 1,Ficolin-1,Ficolin-1-B,Angiopoietin-4,Tenascin-R,Ryncolin-2,Techylectin-5B,Fibrinogen C domain-containing protein 1-A,Microfibril-associated glycoprotein 4,Fibrinogen-like protein A,Ryncolin-3,Ficolin-2,Fibrinogen alpha chain,Tenascin,Angiopoietin-related protein 2,Techylectin-5A,R
MHLIYPLVLSLMFCTNALATRAHVYYVNDDLKISSDLQQFTSIVTVKSEIECTSLCFSSKTCCKASYNPSVKQCMVDVINYCDGYIELDTDWKTFTKDKVTEPNCQSRSPKDCSYLSGQPSGIYTIYPTGSCGMFVYCEMNSSLTNSPLTVFQRREDGSVNFYRNWEAYKKGFGNPLGEFWLGNDNLHYLSTQANYRLMVILEDWENETRYAVYDSFRVGDENSFYFMTVQGYSGDAGDSMAVHNGHRFSTYDKDNDMDESMNCAKDYKGGWWYYSCFHANLNALYIQGQQAPGTGQVVAWDQFRGNDYSLRRSVMMLEKK